MSDFVGTQKSKNHFQKISFPLKIKPTHKYTGVGINL